jgi:hypothetical protein
VDGEKLCSKPGIGYALETKAMPQWKIKFHSHIKRLIHRFVYLEAHIGPLHMDYCYISAIMNMNPARRPGLQPRSDHGAIMV